ncbi:glycosyltransferase family 4 protein [Ornithinimicrobium ciconiae]|uniref:Glycosyltransferase family 4 protein n=1 Tax=Ornithinimicrobium ciconiae TaxID=2594265 RepID=A0A516GAN6_9MICO|nr:glycosyltransferase [Ornithinimicrobium ciconiae]QDO88591.1 glycosyltransferase family 4 protein [Ornithinimicrobium ciconiae]
MHVVILAAASHPLREPFAGGLESLTWHLVRGLRERGVEVTLFSGPGTDPDLGAHEILVEPLDLSDAARRDVAMPAERWLREHHSYLQAMLELRDRTDVDLIHNNSLHYLPIALAATVPMSMVTTLHTPPTPWLEPAIRLMDQRRAQFVAVSGHTARSWRHVTTPDVVLNGVDVDAWRPGPGGSDLVWFGRLVPEKAPHEALSIARRAGYRIRLAGPVADRDYFEGAVRPLLGPHAEYLGHLGTADLAALVGQSAATLVTPVWDEPYGLVAAESLACGTPVLGYERGGLPEFVPPHCGVLVPGGDVAEAARQVDAATGLHRVACRRQAEQHCSIDRMIDAYLEVYSRLLSPGRAA